jgi:hypothetical protein
LNRIDEKIKIINDITKWNASGSNKG